MTTTARALLTCALLLVASACSATGGGSAAPASTTTTSAPTTTSSYVADDCPMEVGDGIQVDCGWLTVPADRAELDGSTVRLAVARIGGGVEARDRDPVVVIEGGPGAGSLDRVDLYAGIATSVGRDFVLWDQRGTGYSTPSLSCDDLRPDPADEVPRTDDPILARCALGAQEAGIDVADYSTIATEGDLEDLRLALGIERWNLWSNSYGTVVAQHALRTHPAGIATALLGGPVRLDRGIGHLNEDAAAEASVEQLSQACSADARCAERYGDVVALADRAATAIDDEYAGMDEDDARHLIMRASYSSDALGRLPGILQQAADGDPAGAVDALDAIEREELPDVSVLQQVSMLCNDLGGLEPTDPGCAIAEVPTSPPSFNEPLSGTNVPVMVVFGRFDPVIERPDAEAVAASLGVPLTVVQASHDAIRSSACVQSVWSRWLEDPTEPPPADRCLDRPITFS